ncbi:hypothetical protein [Cupriavidus metallidurans]|uniref:hypothetical protein n=1 Tax=Cupriavidus metallidurans TaxID=119219 RepID=UPI001BFC14A1|nr:hypothetical protein [Cupriavidus metallidurans]QWC89300.1 hypothetical protein KB891_03595 [Cupriavidus metallidurans]
MTVSNAKIRPSASIPPIGRHQVAADLFLGPVVIALVLFLSLLIPIRDAKAQTLSADGLSWGVTKSGPDTASVNNGALAIATTFAVAATWYGVKNITPVGRVVTVGASVAGPIIANMLRTAQTAGKIAGSPAMLALALALGGANLAYDASSNTFTSPGQYGPLTWFQPNHDKTGPFWDNPMTACQALGGNHIESSGGMSNGYYLQYNCYSGGPGNWVSLGGIYSKPGGGQTQASTDAQLAAAASTPAALAKAWDAASDSDKEQLIGGGVPGTPTFPNGDTMQFPPRTTTGAGTDGQGRPMNGTFTMLPSVKVVPNTGADAIKNPVAVQPSQVNTWSGTDAVGNPVSGTNTTTYPTQTAPPASQAGSGGTTVNVETCGLPGKPPCKIDEGGTPTEQSAEIVATTRQAIDDAMRQQTDALKDVLKGEKPETDWFSWLPVIPRSECKPMTIDLPLGETATVDWCPAVEFMKVLSTVAWTFTIMGGCIAEVKDALNGA